MPWFNDTNQEKMHTSPLHFLGHLHFQSIVESMLLNEIMSRGRWTNDLKEVIGCIIVLLPFNLKANTLIQTEMDLEVQKKKKA